METVQVENRAMDDFDLKAMDDFGVVMTPFGDVVTVILVVNSYVCRLVLLSS